MHQKFRLKNINKTRNYFLEEIERNELMSKKHKNLCTTQNYIKPWPKAMIEHCLILASTITKCISISAFASLQASSVIGLKSCVIAARIKSICK